MDAGLAAVLGAAIGGLTAFGTSWFGLRSARLQVQHQESEAARQRRFESLTERRGPRSQAYAEFVAAGQELVDCLHAREVAEFMAQFDALQSNIRKRRASVAIAGPDAVVTAAAEFANEVRHMRNELAHHQETRPWVYLQKIEGRLEAFTKVARTVLEDEGHPPGA